MPIEKGIDVNWRVVPPEMHGTEKTLEMLGALSRRKGQPLIVCPVNKDIIRMIKFGCRNFEEFLHLDGCQVCRNRLELIGAFTTVFPVLINFGDNIFSVPPPMIASKISRIQCEVIPCFENCLFRELDPKSLRLTGGIISSEGIPTFSGDGRSATVEFSHCWFSKRVRRALEAGSGVVCPVTLSGRFSSRQLRKHKIFGQVRAEFGVRESHSLKDCKTS